MRRDQIAFSILLALSVAACSKSKDNTELVVTVWSDLAVPTEMDALRIRVLGKEQTVDHPFQLSGDRHAGTYQIPVQLALVPAANKDLSINVTAIGSSGGTDIVWQQAVLPFIPGQARELPLYLARSCKNVSCADNSGFTCDNGACTKPVAVNPAELPTYVPGQVASAPDAGPVRVGPDAKDAPADLPQKEDGRAVSDSLLASDAPVIRNDAASVKPDGLTLPDSLLPAERPQGGHCGDGTMQRSEECDDGNTESGDGCNRICQVEANWICPEEGKPCKSLSICGDGILTSDETCDDGNRKDGDGCSADCMTIEPGYECRAPGRNK